MPRVAIFVGVVLVLLGLGAYLGAGRSSVTALIPAFFGLPIALAGAVALRPALRKHGMHAAAAIGLLGLLGAGGRAVPKVLANELSTAVYVQLVMALICLAFVGACVASFIAARGAQRAA